MRSNARLHLAATVATMIVGAGCASSAGGNRDSGAADATYGDAAIDGASAPGLTWTDSATGLTWQVPGVVELDWAQSNQYCADLVLAGHDDWRMPSISELRTLIRGCPNTETGGSCMETDTCSSVDSVCYDGQACIGCTDRTGGPGVGGCYWPTEMGSACGWTWSSTEADGLAGWACFADFTNAHLSHNIEHSDPDVGHRVVCVRP